MSDDDPSIEDIFSALMTVTKARYAAAPVLTMRTLIRFRLDPTFSLTADQQRTLFSDKQLRARWADLKSRFPPGAPRMEESSVHATTAVPALAAAASPSGSAEDWTRLQRKIHGGEIACSPVTGLDRQRYLRVALDETAHSGLLLVLLMYGAAGIAKREIGVVEEDGTAVAILNLDNSSDIDLLRLVFDLSAEGELMFVALS